MDSITGNAELEMPQRLHDADNLLGINRPKIAAVEGPGMVLEKEELTLAQALTAAPDRHGATLIVLSECHGDVTTIDRNISLAAADFVAGKAGSTLDQGDAGWQIPAFCK